MKSWDENLKQKNDCNSLETTVTEKQRSPKHSGSSRGISKENIVQLAIDIDEDESTDILSGKYPKINFNVINFEPNIWIWEHRLLMI